ncbi:MAG: class I mannose-6-phosphate isomerase [Nocardioidaceae bacterium]
MTRYEPNPRYAPVGGEVVAGWQQPVDELLHDRRAVVLAVDGPAVLDWEHVVDGVCAAVAATGATSERVDLRTHFAPWPDVVATTASAVLGDDADFERIAGGELSQVFARMPELATPGAGVLVVFGPGAALAGHDVLWYVDLPKRFAEAEVSAGGGRNLGQGVEHGTTPTTRRLFYVDWPLLDRHRDAIAGSIDRWFDVQDPARPVSIDASTLQQTMQALARQPFRTRPTFNTKSWGGHWAQACLGFNPDERSTALGYELIAPESGVLVGQGDLEVELPFQLVVAARPAEVLGPRVHAVFGTSFPIRFDYLDTVGGGNLSVHCHPETEYMRQVFGWPYTQHETYYVMVGGQDRLVYLGLRGQIDVEEFRARAHDAEVHGEPFDVGGYVQTWPAEQHQLFCIPAGTPHGSGEGNVVLEVSATPYLYSLRFYDWLRRDADGRSRPVHVEHAFANLDTSRTGDAVGADLVQPPETLRKGEGWSEELLGWRPEMFFEVRRLVLGRDHALVDDDASTEFHVLNVVEGDAVEITSDAGARHRLSYAETMVIPAAVGRYTVRRLSTRPTRVLKALVR